jgi:hypothetical protein
MLSAALLVGTQADANPIAYASLSITNLLFQKADGSALGVGTGLGLNSFSQSYTGSLTGSLSGVGSFSALGQTITTAGGGQTGMCVGTSCPVDNTFAITGGNAPPFSGATLARADNALSGSILSGGQTQKTVAEVQAFTGLGSGEADINSSDTFVFEAGISTAVRLSFDAISTMVAGTGPDTPNTIGHQFATNQWQFTISEIGAGNITTALGTTAASLGSVSWDTPSDGLGFAVANLNGNSQHFDLVAKDGSGQDIILNAGSTYKLQIAHTSRVTFEATPVPEPATIGLFGMGLLGLGVLRRRKAAA